MDYKNIENYKNYLLKNNKGNITTRLKVASNFVASLNNQPPNQQLIDNFCINPTRKSIIKHFLLANKLSLYNPDLETPITFSRYTQITKFLEHKYMTSCSSEITIKTYKGRLEKFLDFYDGTINSDITEFLKHKKLTEQNNYNVLLNQFFKYLKIDIEQIQISKKMLNNKRTETIKNKLLSREEINKILRYSESLDTSDFIEYNLKSIILFSVFTGSRVMELYKASMKDINIKENEILLHGKGGKVRTVTLQSNRLLSDHIKQHLKKYTDKDLPLIMNNSHLRMAKNTIQKKIKIVFRQLGFSENKSIHSLRHSFATILYENGVSLDHIQAILGHSNQETTKIYANISHMANKAIKGKMKI
jgi:site-specific recombinase XerD